MAKVEILVSPTSELDIQVLLNHNPVKFDIVDNKITADLDFFGLAMLSIKSLSTSKINIENLFIDKVSIRQFLFLSWVEKDNQKIQPCTELWEQDLTWHVPISNPLSLLISIAGEKFKNGELGTNLFDKYDIRYPESINVDSGYPKLVQDFYKYNFDFYVHKKIDKDALYANNNVPYYVLNFKFDARALYQELNSNYEYLINEEVIKPFQFGYNQDDLGTNFDSKLNWRTVYPYIPKKDQTNSLDDFALDKNRLPLLFDLYQQLPTNTIYHSFISIMPPHSFIAPHIDVRKPSLPQGCAQLYFALNPSPDEHFFKINSVGLVPLIDQIVVVNNQNFTHAVVNQSSEPRYVIGCFADVSKDFYSDIV